MLLSTEVSSYKHIYLQAVSSGQKDTNDRYLNFRKEVERFFYDFSIFYYINLVLLN